MKSLFHFYTHACLIRLLNIRVTNPVELLKEIKTVSGSSIIYYHIHRFLQQHH
jgi:hypothetical protein